MTFEHAPYPGSGDSAVEVLISHINDNDPNIFVAGLKGLYEHYKLAGSIYTYGKIAIGTTTSPLFDPRYRPYVDGALFGLLYGLGVPKEDDKNQLAWYFDAMLTYLHTDTSERLGSDASATELRSTEQALVHEWGEVGLVILDEDEFDAVEVLAEGLHVGSDQNEYFMNGFGLTTCFVRRLELHATDAYRARDRVQYAGDFVVRHFTGPQNSRK